MKKIVCYLLIAVMLLAAHLLADFRISFLLQTYTERRENLAFLALKVAALTETPAQSSIMA